MIQELEEFATFGKVFVSALILSFSYLVLRVCIPPWEFPKNIPTIPFYVAFLPMVFDIDQIDLYNIYIREPMEKHGAVKMFFAARWNVLVSRAEFLAQIFRDDSTFTKSGNQKKIPYSLLARYTGDNIISAHGENWKKYRAAIMPGLRYLDESSIYENTRKFCDLISERLTSNNKTVVVGPLIQRLALDNIAKIALGINFNALNDKEPNDLHEHLLRIKKEVFKPLFMAFPFLDLLPIPSRRRGMDEIDNFKKLLVERTEQELVKNYKFEQTNFASSHLIRAYNNEELSKRQLFDNMVILLVAGHENPQIFITTLLYLLGKYEETWQRDIRLEIGSITDIDDLAQLPLLNSFLYETIRFYPPLSNIVNRLTNRTCKLGSSIVIPANTYVGYHNFGNSHDPHSWGPKADVFDPLRWGHEIEAIDKAWRRSKNRSALSSFHGGKRACVGEKLAMNEARVAIAELLKRFEWRLSKDWTEKMTPAGPLAPLNLKLDFKEL